MKILKIVLVIVAVVLGTFTIYNATLSKEYSVSRTTTMDVDPALVQQIVSDFSTWPEWSAWFLADSTMEYELGTTYVGEGATYSWTSENSGSGAMEILQLTASAMETKIDFVGQGTSYGHWEFTTSNEGKALVSWGFSGEMPLLMRWMGAQMDKWVGPDFETGLANLTAYAEREAIANEVAQQQTMQPVEVLD